MNRRTDGERGVRRIVLKKRKMVEKRGNPHTTREPLIILFARTLSLLTVITLTSLPFLPSLHPLTLPYTSLHLLTRLTLLTSSSPYISLPSPPSPSYTSVHLLTLLNLLTLITLFALLTPPYLPPKGSPGRK